MKVILAGLGLLPVIACHVYLQLLPQAAGLHAPLGLRQSNPKDPETFRSNLQSAEAAIFGDLLDSSPEAPKRFLRQSTDSQGLQEFGSADQAPARDWSPLDLGRLEDQFESLSRGKKSANYAMSVRLPEGYAAEGDAEGGSAPFQRPHSLSPFLGLKRAGQTPSHRPNSPMGGKRSGAPTQQRGGDKGAPSKRYLGIELPDYIASNYGTDKASSIKLHNLKQRMRSVGK